jgi:RNA-splicing ligase RtcB
MRVEAALFGCVVATEEVLIPAAVGYDIHCGMRLMSTGLSAARADIQGLARAIRRDIDLVIEAVVGAGLERVVAKMRPLAVLKG